MYVHLLSRVKTKFEPRAVKCVFLGYGVTQKGYRCYNPIQNKLYTTMDCDFFEQSYYYTQPRSQGESVSEDLSWLIHPLVDSRDPKEQVGNTADIASENTVSSSPHATPAPEHPVEQEVTPNPPFIDMSNDDTVPSIDVPRRYEFPPRSTRGVPLRRYDPEFES